MDGSVARGPFSFWRRVPTLASGRSGIDLSGSTPPPAPSEGLGGRARWRALGTGRARREKPQERPYLGGRVRYRLYRGGRGRDLPYLAGGARERDRPDSLETPPISPNDQLSIPPPRASDRSDHLSGGGARNACRHTRILSCTSISVCDRKRQWSSDASDDDAFSCTLPRPFRLASSGGGAGSEYR